MSDSQRDFLTIVSGLPRSGTSMMMKMLDVGGMPVVVDWVRTADEDNPGGYYEFEPVKRTKEDPSWLEGTEGKVVKMVYKLLYDLPRDRKYRVLFMRRHLKEVLRSQRIMLERNEMKSDVSNEEMARMFVSELVRCEFWMKRQRHLTYMDVDYNQMLKDPRPIVEDINEFLGGGLDTDAMVGVVNPDLYRNRAQ